MRMRMMLMGVALVAATANAQGPGPARGRGGFPGGPPPPGGPPMGAARILGAEVGMPGRVVKNAPYSGELVSESTQVLADGNRIRQTNSARVYRDSEGRTRRENSLSTLGGLAPNGDLPQMVFITDPVAGLSYAVNAKERTATKSTWRQPPGRGAGDRPARPQPPQGQEANARPALRGRNGGQNQNVRTESLGQQSIEGVLANGTRTTMTIPAGQMGNELPIQIVSETWYSAELQMTILSKRSDPRSGETVSKLINISRTEPGRVMFEVPADYKMAEPSMMRGRNGGPPPVRR